MHFNHSQFDIFLCPIQRLIVPFLHLQFISKEFSFLRILFCVLCLNYNESCQDCGWSVHREQLREFPFESWHCICSKHGCLISFFIHYFNIHLALLQYICLCFEHHSLKIAFVPYTFLKPSQGQQPRQYEIGELARDGVRG